VNLKNPEIRKAVRAVIFLLVLVSKRMRKKYEREPLTVAMLQYAIDLGVWDSEHLRKGENQRPKD